MTKENKNKLLLKISKLYYLENKTQEEISNTLNISRPQVSRFLAQAKEEGIISIKINDPNKEASKYEEQMKEKFGLEEALLVDYPITDDIQFMNKVAEEAEDIFSRYIKNGYTIATSAGRALTLLSNCVHPINKTNLTILPSGGGLSIKTDCMQSNSIVFDFAKNWNCTGLNLNVPYYVSYKETKDALLKENEIKEVFNEAKNADILITGLGHVNDFKNYFSKGGPILDNEYDELINKGAILTCCGSFIDINGKEIDCLCQKKSLNIKLCEFNKDIKIIAVAYGYKKIEPIIAGLRTKKISTLIVDLDTAKKILDYK